MAYMLKTAPHLIELSTENQGSLQTYGLCTLESFGLKSGCTIKAIAVVSNDKEIPKAKLLDQRGKINPDLKAIIHDWYNMYISPDAGVMTPETCRQYLTTVR